MRYPRGVCRNRLATANRPVLSSPGPRRRDARGSAPRQWIFGDLERRPVEPATLRVRPSPGSRDPARLPRQAADSSSFHLGSGLIDRMDAKQVWRAALGELQVSLSPANFETWLRDTQLVDVDEQRFRIGVPNGFAKDWLENRYRSLISQTLARIVGYSVQVEFFVGPGPEASAPAEGGGGPAGAHERAPRQ